MAEFKIDINNILFSQFGVYSLLHYPEAGALPDEVSAGDFGKISVVTDDPSDGNSLLGTPVFAPVFISGGTYQTLKLVKGVPTTVSVDYDGYDFPSTTLCVFNRTKNIVKTRVQGADNSVKELISMDDWTVTISGILGGVPGTNKYPDVEVQALRNLFEVPAALQVSGRLFNLLGIKNLVLENLNLPQLEGIKNIQPFQMTASSDTPLEIQQKNSKS